MRERHSGEIVANYHPGWFGNGRLKPTHGGESWRWRGLTVWRTRFGFLDDRRKPLVTFRARMQVPPSAEVTLGDRAFGLDALPLLVVLGWYVTILALDDLASGGRAALTRR